jgi:hypothetical protein
MDTRMVFCVLAAAAFVGGCTSADIPQAYRGRMFDRTGPLAFYSGKTGFTARYSIREPTSRPRTTTLIANPGLTSAAPPASSGRRAPCDDGPPRGADLRGGSGGPLDRNGVHVGDVIVAVGEPVSQATDVPRLRIGPTRNRHASESDQPGTEVRFTLIRERRRLALDGVLGAIERTR